MAFRYPQPVLFKHCDPAGIVFYPRYFEMMNDCVEAFFAHIGHPMHEVLKEGGVPTGQIGTRFQNPSRHGDALVLVLEGQKLGRSSFRFEINAFAGEEPRFSTAQVIVHVDRNDKAAAWPEGLRQALQQHI